MRRFKMPLRHEFPIPPACPPELGCRACWPSGMRKCAQLQCDKPDVVDPYGGTWPTCSDKMPLCLDHFAYLKLTGRLMAIEDELLARKHIAEAKARSLG